tara:strand:- start:99 stop:680 length:582 start_codon:yes stop_codon:yes gene_type:complete
MAINKRPEDFTPEDIDKLIKENRQLRFENSLLKGRTHAREWKGGGFTPNKKDNPLSSIIQYRHHVSEYTAFFQSLSFILTQAGAIKKDDTFSFQEAFNGFGTPAKCEWLIQKNLCVYLIDLLIDKKIVSKTKRDKYTTQYFGIKDPSKTRNTYWYNKSQKPRNYQAIDKIVESTLEITDTTPIKIESPETPLY